MANGAGQVARILYKEIVPVTLGKFMQNLTTLTRVVELVTFALVLTPI